eukprot:4023673-Pyramimonas_sp.AAC.1
MGGWLPDSGFSTMTRRCTSRPLRYPSDTMTGDAHPKDIAAPDAGTQLRTHLRAPATVWQR